MHLVLKHLNKAWLTDLNAISRSAEDGTLATGAETRHREGSYAVLEIRADLVSS